MELKLCRQIFEKNIEYHISSKSFLWEPTSSMRTEIQTDMKKKIVAFRNFVNAPKNEKLFSTLSHPETACSQSKRKTTVFSSLHCVACNRVSEGNVRMVK